jgi:hypothetical protein
MKLLQLEEAVHVITRLNADCGIKFDLWIFWEYPCINLADIDREHFSHLVLAPEKNS